MSQAPYTIIRTGWGCKPEGATVQRAGIPTMRLALKELTAIHGELPSRDHLMTDATGKVVRRRYKNGPSTSKTVAADGEPLYQGMADAAHYRQELYAVLYGSIDEHRNEQSNA